MGDAAAGGVVELDEFWAFTRSFHKAFHQSVEPSELPRGTVNNLKHLASSL
jgi:hypothetical protein